MAGDWIKMRTSLQTHPKVVRIASALKADRLRVVGALHAVWCLFDVHSEDGTLPGYTLDALDDLVGWPGFSAALVTVDWLLDHGDAIGAPDFDEHNGRSAKRRAMETERKAVERKLSASDADKAQTKSAPEKRREEKRREDKPEKQKAAPEAPPESLPDWLPLDAWQGYLAMRKKIKKVPTERAIELLIKGLTAMHANGQDIAAVLDNSTRNNWTDVYPIRDQRAGGDRRLNRQEQLEASNRAIAEDLARDMGLNLENQT
jgi:hypothetical protein